MFLRENSPVSYLKSSNAVSREVSRFVILRSYAQLPDDTLDS
jgi:hypothetical protein